jgi:hypothetical protein
VHPCGGESLDIGRDELDQYNRDPDGYAAKHFGFDTAEEYREWINVTGAALCGARIKSGRLCGHPVSRIHLNPAEWKQLHRNVSALSIATREAGHDVLPELQLDARRACRKAHQHSSSIRSA